MELRSLEIYRCPDFDLFEEDTTVGKEISEEKKTQLLEDFPEVFVVLTEEEVAAISVAKEEVEEVAPVIETPEDGLVIETPEAKEVKIRKK